MAREDDIEALTAEWLRRARGNLARARQPKPEEALWEDLCFDAQQAVEKAIKAVLVRDQIEFPRTHDIGDLLDIVAVSGRPLPPDEARNLTDFATVARYPGWDRVVTEDDHRRAIALAERVVSWAREILGGG